MSISPQFFFFLRSFWHGFPVTWQCDSPSPEGIADRGRKFKEGTKHPFNNLWFGGYTFPNFLKLVQELGNGIFFYLPQLSAIPDRDFAILRKIAEPQK